MRDHLRHHAKHMAIGGAAVLALLLAAGVTWTEAARWALLLACPVGMIGMMWFMGRHMGRGAGSEHVHGPHCSAEGTSAPTGGATPGGEAVVSDRV